MFVFVEFEGYVWCVVLVDFVIGCLFVVRVILGLCMWFVDEVWECFVMVGVLVEEELIECECVVFVVLICCVMLC